MDDPAEDQLAALVRDAEAGDPEAWQGLIDRYTPLVMAVVRGFRLQENDVRDVVQTVWLRLLEHLGRLREPRALPGWLITTTRNETLRTLKAQNRTRPLADLGTDTSPVAGNWSDSRLDARPRTGFDEPAESCLDAALLRVERREAVLQAFAELNERDRSLLRLLAADPAVPYAQISTQLGIAVGSIGPTRARILAKVRAHPAVTALIEDEWQVPAGVGSDRHSGGNGAGGIGHHQRRGDRRRS